MQTIKYSNQDKRDAERVLLDRLPEGSRIYGLISRKTDMCRWVRVFIVEDGHIEDITGSAARTCAYTLQSDGNQQYIRMAGWGFNAVAAIAEKLSQELYGLGSNAIAYSNL